jgi:hypothetical protein
MEPEPQPNPFLLELKELGESVEEYESNVHAVRSSRMEEEIV